LTNTEYYDNIQKDRPVMAVIVGQTRQAKYLSGTGKVAEQQCIESSIRINSMNRIPQSKYS